MDGAWIRLRPRRMKAFANPNIHCQPALDAAKHMARDDELLLVGLLQVVPNAQAGSAGVRELYVSLGLLAVFDHHVDDVADLNGHFPVSGLKLFERYEPFGFISEIDDYVLTGNSKDCPLQNFVGSGRGKVAVVIEKILVVFGDHLVHLPVVVVYGHYASADH